MILFLILIFQVDLVSTDCNTADLGEATNSFGLDLYKLLPGNEDGNIFFSPFSISTALAMTYLGTAGRTAQEMKATLKFNQCPNYHLLLKEMLVDINRNNQEYTLKAANNLFPSSFIKLNDLYLKEVAEFYFAQITKLDYSDATYAREYINEWVSNNTEEKIKDIISPGILGPNTVLILVNAIYFKADWKYTFDKKDTRPMTFYQPGEKRYKVDMMSMLLRRTKDFVYIEDDSLNAQILELFYKGDDISMVIILPKTYLTNLEGVKAALNFSVLNDIQWKLTNHDFTKPQREVNVWIPKFLMDWKGDIVELLKQMGIQELFSGGDFTRLCTGCQLPVTDVIHQAFVEVNEEDKAKKRVSSLSCLTEKPCMKLYTGELAPECCGCRFMFKDPSKKRSKPAMVVLKKLKRKGRDDCLEKCLNEKCRGKFGM